MKWIGRIEEGEYMENWKRLSELLVEEKTLWQKIFAYNQEQIDSVSGNNLLQKEENFLLQKEIYLEEIDSLQQEQDEIKLLIEAEFKEIEKPLQALIRETLEELQHLRENLQIQEQQFRQIIEMGGSQTRNEIKQIRDRKTMKAGYFTSPLLEESALLDEKK